MFVEIKGVNFFNKGAELMMHAVLQKVGKIIPHAKFVLTANSVSPYIKRAKLGLYQKICFSKFNIPFGIYFGKYVHPKLRERFGLVCHEEINIVFDASGFSYSDQWGPENCILMSHAIEKWKNTDTKVILLPQAMGPFSGSKIRKAFRKVLNNVDLVFPRDTASYNYVTDLVGYQRNIIQAPDFTNLVNATLPDSYKEMKNRFCIIPNYRMVDKTSSEKGKKYFIFLVNCILYLLKQNILPFILIHEGDKDYYFSKKLCKYIGKELKIIQEDNPLVIKGIIGECSGVISSRFHGIVSALSQGIPAIATGWSHKYVYLFEEYGFPEGCVDVNSSIVNTNKIIDLLTNRHQANQLKSNLLLFSDIHKKRSEEMWDKVFKCIGV